MTALDKLIASMRAYLHLPNADNVAFAAAVAVTATAGGDPCWGLLVGAPSGGKTETIRAFGDVADATVDDITGPGLLGWTGGPRRGHPIGLLTCIGDGTRAFATVADLSTLLAQSDKGYRETLYALLRRAYDGDVIREHGQAPRPLRWHGRLMLLAAVTPEIDRYASHTDALGPRWLYWRLPSDVVRPRFSEDLSSGLVHPLRVGLYEQAFGS